MTWLSLPKKIAGGDSVTSGFCGVFGSTACADVIAVAVAPSGTDRDGAGVVAQPAMTTSAAQESSVLIKPRPELIFSFFIIGITLFAPA
jgi:hypothetical protein